MTDFFLLPVEKDEHSRPFGEVCLSLVRPVVNMGVFSASLTRLCRWFHNRKLKRPQHRCTVGFKSLRVVSWVVT